MQQACRSTCSRLKVQNARLCAAFLCSLTYLLRINPAFMDCKQSSFLDWFMLECPQVYPCTRPW